MTVRNGSVEISLRPMVRSRSLYDQFSKITFLPSMRNTPSKGSVLHCVSYPRCEPHRTERCEPKGGLCLFYPRCLTPNGPYHTETNGSAQGIAWIAQTKTRVAQCTFRPTNVTACTYPAPLRPVPASACRSTPTHTTPRVNKNK